MSFSFSFSLELVIKRIEQAIIPVLITATTANRLLLVHVGTTKATIIYILEPLRTKTLIAAWLSAYWDLIVDLYVVVQDQAAWRGTEGANSGVIHSVKA